MKHTIKPFGRSFGIIALLVVALVFSFAVLVSCESPNDGKAAENGSEITIDENGYWKIDGELYRVNGEPVRAYMSYPEIGDIKPLDQGQLNQTYGNVIPLVVVPLLDYGMKAEDITVRYGNTGGSDGKGKYLPERYSVILSGDPSGGPISSEKEYVKLPIDSGAAYTEYAIYLDIKGRNGYYFPQRGLVTGATLRVNRTSPTADDYALVPAVDFSGDPITPANILGPNRVNLPATTELIELLFKKGNDLPYNNPRDAGRYEVTFKTPSNEYWNASTTTLNKGFFTINQGIPENSHYNFYLEGTIFPATTEQEAYLAATPIKPITAEPKSGIVNSDAIPGPALYTGVAPEPAWGPDSEILPTVPGNFTVKFIVPASENGNWTGGTLTSVLKIIPPTLTSITAPDGFSDWMATLDATEEGFFYKIFLQVGDLVGDVNTVGSVGYVLGHYNNNERSVFLDLSKSSSLAVIPQEAFDKCKNLVGIVLPDSIMTIGEEAFTDTKIKTVSIPDNVDIGNYAFNPCTDLTEVIFGTGVTFGSNSFSGNLSALYDNGGAGTYKKVGGDWVKQ